MTKAFDLLSFTLTSTISTFLNGGETLTQDDAGTVWVWERNLWGCSGPTACKCFSFLSPANVKISFVILSYNWDAHQANTHTYRSYSRHRPIWSIGQGPSWKMHASMSWAARRAAECICKLLHYVRPGARRSCAFWSIWYYKHSGKPDLESNARQMIPGEQK